MSDHRRSRRAGFATALLLAVSIAPSAHAGCTGLILVTATPLVFISYDPLSLTARDAASVVTLSCVGLGTLPDATLKLSTGLGGSFAPRSMKLLTFGLSYNLYRDSNRTLVWGDGTQGTSTQTYSAGQNAVSRDFNVYGRIPVSQNAVPGVYADLITVTVDF